MKVNVVPADKYQQEQKDIKTVTVKQDVTVEIPDGYMLVPDYLDDWRIHFHTPEETVSMHVLTWKDLPEVIGPFQLVRKEMGAASYEIHED